MTIRSYGPGKFYTILDSHAYGVTLDGGADEEASYPEGEGWYGLLWLDDATRDRILEIAEEDDEPLNDDEEQQLDDHVAIIFFERSDGIVEADWFEDKAEAEARWADIEEDTAGDEDDEEEENADV